MQTFNIWKKLMLTAAQTPWFPSEIMSEFFNKIPNSNAIANGSLDIADINTMVECSLVCKDWHSHIINLIKYLYKLNEPIVKLPSNDSRIIAAFKHTFGDKICIALDISGSMDFPNKMQNGKNAIHSLLFSNQQSINLSGMDCFAFGTYPIGIELGKNNNNPILNENARVNPFFNTSIGILKGIKDKVNFFVSSCRKMRRIKNSSYFELFFNALEERCKSQSLLKNYKIYIVSDFEENCFTVEKLQNLPFKTTLVKVCNSEFLNQLEKENSLQKKKFEVKIISFADAQQISSSPSFSPSHSINGENLWDVLYTPPLLEPICDSFNRGRAGFDRQFFSNSNSQETQKYSEDSDNETGVEVVEAKALNVEIIDIEEIVEYMPLQKRKHFTENANGGASESGEGQEPPYKKRRI